MVKRHAGASFGAAYAFPGGVLDPEDRLIHEYCEGLSAEEADARLGVPHEALDYYSAAIRELFEESGVLLADVLSVTEPLDAVRDGLGLGLPTTSDRTSQERLLLRLGVGAAEARLIVSYPRVDSSRGGRPVCSLRGP